MTSKEKAVKFVKERFRIIFPLKQEEILDLVASHYVEYIIKKMKITESDKEKILLENFQKQQSIIGMSPEVILPLFGILTYEVGSLWETDGKYKKAKEVYDCIRLVIAMRKVGMNFLIISDENPDLMLAMDKNTGGKLDINDRIAIEHMNIPKLVTDKWVLDPELKLSEMIKKKFLKRYGRYQSLLVHLSYQGKIDFRRVSRMISSAENPYMFVWLTFFSSEDNKEFTCIMLHPPYSRVEVTMEDKKKYLINPRDV